MCNIDMLIDDLVRNGPFQLAFTEPHSEAQGQSRLMHTGSEGLRPPAELLKTSAEPSTGHRPALRPKDVRSCGTSHVMVII